MTYNEWRDELKVNLLSVSETERRRVLDYYAEAYADRRDAGYSENQIIQDFGAPYDAAQRILLNICDEQEYSNSDSFCAKNPQKEEIKQEKSTNSTQKGNVKSPNMQSVPEKARQAVSKMKGHPVLAVILCILIALPMLILVITLSGISIGFIVAPFALLVAGISSLGFGIVELFSDVLYGVYEIGEGLVMLGLCIIVAPLIIKFVQFLWKMLKKFFVWIGGVFSGKERKV